MLLETGDTLWLLPSAVGKVLWVDGEIRRCRIAIVARVNTWKIALPVRARSSHLVYLSSPM